MARRNSRLYLIGLGVSLLGSGAMSLVAGVWVRSLTGSSAAAGLVSACVYAPSLLGPVAGLIADRLDRRRLLVAVNLLSGVITLSLLAVRSRGDVWVIYLVMASYGAQLALSGPAESGLFAELLPLPQRLRVNGLRLGLQETARVVAPLIGAGLFTVVGGSGVAALDALTFLIAAWLTAMLRFRSQPRARAGAASGRELLAGFAHVRSVPLLRAVAIAAAAAMALSGVVVAAQYSLVSALGQRPAFLGVLAAGLGVGSVVAALSAARVQRRIGERGLVLAGLCNYALGSALYATATIPTALLGSLVLGFALPWIFLAALNAAQRLTPQELQGRVSAALTLMLFGPLAPLQALGAWAITQTGFRSLYLGAAFTAGLLALAFARLGLGAPDAQRPQRRSGERPRAGG